MKRLILVGLIALCLIGCKKKTVINNVKMPDIMIPKTAKVLKGPTQGKDGNWYAIVKYRGEKSIWWWYEDGQLATCNGQVAAYVASDEWWDYCINVEDKYKDFLDNTLNNPIHKEAGLIPALKK